LVKAEQLLAAFEMLFGDQEEAGYFQTEATTYICSIAEGGESAAFALGHFRRWLDGLIAKFS
jgi:hypothetical protein